MENPCLFLTDTMLSRWPGPPYDAPLLPSHPAVLSSLPAGHAVGYNFSLRSSGTMI